MMAIRIGMAAALLAAAPRVLAAQAPDPAQRVTLHVATGAAATEDGALGEFDGGWTVLLGLRLPLPESGPLSVQLDALHLRVTGPSYEVVLPADGSARVERRASLTAVGGSLVLAPRTGGRARPYLIGGGAIYRLTRNDHASAEGVEVASGTRTAPGLSFGGGLEARLGRVVPFAELRYHLVFLEGGGDVVTGEKAKLIPFVAGVRF